MRSFSWPADAVPSESPLAMPIQSLSAEPDRRPILADSLTRRRAWLLAFTIVLSLAASVAMTRAFAADRFTVLELVALPLFASLFAWTAFSCASAAVGFLALWRESPPREGGPLPTVSSRNAVLMPVYNEAPGPVFARLAAMLESLRTVRSLDHFDLFILSDTREQAVAIEEREAYDRLCARFEGQARVYYRRRAENTDRKAGNIAEWVRRFGGAYDHMVVLDADSLMTGDTLVRLAAAMEAAPGAGLIQTVPMIINARTLFARLEQFASRLYGPMFARGLEWWSGAESSYWGHNAIIRVKAFAEQAGLPHLRGPQPFGGAIMSHDFVEAALLRRAGWEVRLASQMGGSYEESPPSLIDQIVRDRRWCQGNLQHIAVIAARGLHPLSRFHLLRGFSTYLTAPLWLGLLSVGLLLAAFPALAGAGQDDPTAFTRPELLSVLWVSLAMLLAPKLMAWAVLVRRGRADGFGGARRALAGVGLETLVSSLVAPIVLFAQTRALFEILTGRDCGWATQRRDAETLTLRDTLRVHRGETIFGLVLVGVGLIFAPNAFVWIAVPALALTFAFVVSAWTAENVDDLALLETPETLRPPRLLDRAVKLRSAAAVATLAASNAPPIPLPLPARLGYETA
ncbi:glucans biosynthesis glucosyltransferase MdoH [Caulobacter sp. RL271]|jgi:membrane glycosyltransferase|uniref:Glucans biosynthesis glucosyltransferase H n=1 Tax=Caulobacter segnis TaxID=88688 RepID=A0ABY4ZRX8_9CAUL|nr:glucans biosynthesis glucosyltransferase MdoH [Caulobacter segnis]USQ95557.1 glucans biosynthesis glucosyltransferase MdoH [Caulobacter segnis]